jgi:hypothetical protein
MDRTLRAVLVAAVIAFAAVAGLADHRPPADAPPPP